MSEQDSGRGGEKADAERWVDRLRPSDRPLYRGPDGRTSLDCWPPWSWVPVETARTDEHADRGVGIPESSGTEGASE